MDSHFIENADPTTPEQSSNHIISQNDAIDIANRILGKSSSRSDNPTILQIDYVTGNQRSRSYNNVADTLAYIINYPNEEGFVIVASTNNVYPVLAFSDQGHFSLSDGHIVFLSGNDIESKQGHAWISDGCYYCVNFSDPTQIINPYIHCDWGWDGSCNGYYSGAVFEATPYKFAPTLYFAVKINSSLLEENS